MVDTEHRTSKKDSVRITATLSTAQHEALVELAGRKKVSVAWLIREAVDKLVEDMDGGRRLPFDS
jgi:predicted DNA-binding protein